MSKVRLRKTSVQKSVKASRAEKPALFGSQKYPPQETNAFPQLMLALPTLIEVPQLPIGVVRDAVHERLLIRKGPKAEISKVAKKPTRKGNAHRKRATAKPTRSKASIKKTQPRDVEANLVRAPEAIETMISYPQPASQNKPLPTISTAIIVHRKSEFFQILNHWLAKGSGAMRRFFMSKAKGRKAITTVPKNGAAELARLRAENDMLRRRVDDLLDRGINKSAGV